MFVKLAEERNPEVKFGVSYITDVAMALSDHEAVAKVSNLKGFITTVFGVLKWKIS